MIMNILKFSEYNANEKVADIIKVGDTVIVTKDDTSDEPKRSLKLDSEYVVKSIDEMSGWLRLEGEKYLHNPDNFKKIKNKLNEDSATTSAGAGTGTAASGGAIGSFTTANGVNVGGGSSGSAYNTNSSNGMGAIRSSQPSPTPGDVKGSTEGSGDIGSVLGTFSKQPASPRGNFRKRTKKQKDAVSKLNNLYVVKFNDFGVNVKENAYIPPKKVKCQECGEEVEDDLNTLLGHVQNKHWSQPNERFVDLEPRELVTRFFHEIPKK
jgi:hypothetical protein